MHSLSHPISLHSNCLTCVHRCNSLFKELTAPELIALNNNRSEIFFKPGEYIFKEGHKPAGLLCLATGKVKIVKLGHYGVEQIVALRRPVDFIGFEELINQRNYSSGAVALEHCKVCLIENATFISLMHSNSTFTFQLLQYATEEMNYLKTRIADQNQKHMRGRLADALLTVMEVYGLDENNFLNITLYRRDFAGLSNLTTANAIRILNEWHKEGIICIDKRRLQIINADNLHSISIR